MIHDWAVCSPGALKNHSSHLHTIPAADRDIQTSIICRTEANFASMKWESNQLYIVWETFRTWSLSWKYPRDWSTMQKTSPKRVFCFACLFFMYIFYKKKKNCTKLQQYKKKLNCALCKLHYVIIKLMFLKHSCLICKIKNCNNKLIEFNNNKNDLFISLLL